MGRDTKPLRKAYFSNQNTVQNTVQKNNCLTFKVSHTKSENVVKSTFLVSVPAPTTTKPQCLAYISSSVLYYRKLT